MERMKDEEIISKMFSLMGIQKPKKKEGLRVRVWVNW